MGMSTFAALAGTGWVLGYVSKMIVQWLKKVEPTIAPEIQKMIKMLETKFKIDIPDGLEEFFINTVTASINAADKIICDPVFIRNVLRAIIARDPSKLDAATVALQNIDWQANVVAQLPDDIKDIVNMMKEDHATEMIKANMTKVMPVEMIPSESKLRSVIKVAVQAEKINKEVVPVTDELLQKLITESQARQEKLSK